MQGMNLDYRICISDWTLYLEDSWLLLKADSNETDAEFKLHMDP